MEDNNDLPLVCYPNAHRWMGINAHSLSGYAWILTRGVGIDFWKYLADKLSGNERARLFCLSGWNPFWTARIYKQIEDAWNRPIFGFVLGFCWLTFYSGPPSSWIDVMERVEDPHTTRLVVTGNTRHCLNMGSYNYLGFGGPHEVITPQIIRTAMETGVGLRIFCFSFGFNVFQLLSLFFLV